MYVDENNVAHFSVEEIRDAVDGAAKDAADALKAAWVAVQPIAPKVEALADWASRLIACEQALRRIGGL